MRTIDDPHLVTYNDAFRQFLESYQGQSLGVQKSGVCFDYKIKSKKYDTGMITIGRIIDWPNGEQYIMVIPSLGSKLSEYIGQDYIKQLACDGMEYKSCGYYIYRHRLPQHD